MKKFTALLMLICIALLPLVSNAEVPVITWEEVGAPAVESLGLEGEFKMLPELGLAIWVPATMNYIEPNAEQAAEGAYAVFADEDCTLFITALHQDGMTLDAFAESAAASGYDAEIVNVNGLYTVTYKDDESAIGFITLVDTNSNMITFNFSPLNSDLAQAAFSIIASSLKPAE